MRIAGAADTKRALPPPGALVGTAEFAAFDRITPVTGGGADPPATRVVVADGGALWRAALRILLQSSGRIEVVGEASTGEGAIALAARIRPGVVLLDERIPGVDCIEVIRRIVSAPGVAVLLLTLAEDDKRNCDALRAGATGLLLKDTEPAELVRAVEALAQGGALLSPRLTRRLIAELAARPEPEPSGSDLLDVLSVREREIVALVARGLSNGEIAERLVISPATAKTHVSRSMVKLGVRDRAQLVVLAYKARLAVPRAMAAVPPGQPALPRT